MQISWKECLRNSFKNFRRHSSRKVAKRASLSTGISPLPSKQKLSVIDQQSTHGPNEKQCVGKFGVIKTENTVCVDDRDVSFQINATFYQRRCWISEVHPQISEVMEQFPALQNAQFVSR